MSDLKHVPAGKPGSKLESIFVVAREKNASDLYIAPGDHPVIKIHGRLERLTEYPKIEGSQIDNFCAAALTVRQQQELESRMAVEVTFITEAAGSIQIILYATEVGLAAACRLIPTKIPSFHDIGPVQSLKKIATLTTGLVVITGKSNSHKATTLASILDHMNTHQKKCIVTIENPIRFAHTSRSSLIFQREVGLHVPDYASGIRTAMRGDMDVIFFSEIDGPESLGMALNAAESHLVLTTYVSFGGSGWAIRKLFNSFPPERQEYIRTHLSRVLRCLIWQHPVHLEGQKRTKMAMEIMFNNEKIAEFIKKNQLHKVQGEIEKGGEGMQTIHMSLAKIGEIGLSVAAEIGATMLLGI